VFDGKPTIVELKLWLESEGLTQHLHVQELVTLAEDLSRENRIRKHNIAEVTVFETSSLKLSPDTSTPSAELRDVTRSAAELVQSEILDKSGKLGLSRSHGLALEIVMKMLLHFITYWEEMDGGV